MAFLHLINREEIAGIKHFINFNDSVVLMEQAFANLAILKFEAENYYILRDDFKKFSLKNIKTNFILTHIDYAEFVDLTQNFKRVISWN